MANTQIVTLAPEEWRLYRQIRLEALETEPQAFSTRYEEALQNPDAYWQERLSEVRPEKKKWLLFAKEDERIVGMIGAYSAGDSPVVEIISVFVRKEARGQGVGSALMEAVLGVVDRDGSFRKAVLNVNSAQTAAVALYQRFGFQIVGEVRGIQGDGKRSTIYIMEKELGQA